MKVLAWISLIGAIGIAIYETQWVGKSSLAPVIGGLAGLIIIQGIALLTIRREP